MLEGAEFMEFKRFEAQAKGLPRLGDAPIVAGELEISPTRRAGSDE
jgi:hypothetical protein